MKIKAPILIRIALWFLAALIISATSTYYISYNYMLRKAEAQGEETARAAATAALVAIGPEGDLAALYDDAEYREEMHQKFRYICQRTDIRYMYLYTVDPHGYRHYIICAANSDEDDERMQTEYGFGSVREIPLYEAEKNVLNGSKDEDFEVVDNDYGSVCMNVVPVIDSNNGIVALIGIDHYIEHVERTAKNNLRNLLMIGMMIIAVAYIIALLLIRRSVVQPIVELSDEMKSFARERKEHTGTYRRKTVYQDEILEIETSFDKMTADICQYVRDNEALMKEQLLHQTELDVARGIQNGIVPEESSLSGEGYEFYGCERPAREVGGDFYDAFLLDDGQVCVVIGDISGKGISAALFMAMVKTSIRDKLLAGLSLLDTFQRVNRELCMSNPENMFATVFALTLQPESGMVTFVNAGHEQPLLLVKDPSYREVESGILLGVFEDADFTEEKLALRDGDGILLFTDGITEAVDSEEQMYGKDRLRETVLHEYLEDAHSYDPRILVNNTVASVFEYTSGREQFDDITCLALIYKEDETHKKILTPQIESFDTVKETILSTLGESDQTRNIVLACEEMFANIVNYSGADEVIFSGKSVGDSWLVTFDDNGTAFDPVAAEQKELEFEKLDQGGMGIMLAKMNCREMIYSRLDDRNVLTMIFDADGDEEQEI